MKNLIFLMLGIVFFGNRGIAQAGVIDTTFGNNGVIYCETDYGYSDTPMPIMDSQGRMVTLSDLVDVPGFLLVRCLADGSYDKSFGINGHVYVNPGGLIHPKFLRILEDGMMLVTGSIEPLPGDSTSDRFDFFIVRLNAQGVLDSSFSQNGLVRVDFQDGMDVEGLAIQEDRKMLVSGRTGTILFGGGNTDVVLMRILSDGKLDGTFGTGGIVITDLSASGWDIDIGGPIAIQPDGKIVVAAKNGDWFNSIGYFAIMRFESNGMLDTSFANKGISIDTLSYIPFSWDIAITDNLSLLVAGKEGDVFGGGFYFTLRQYTPQGYLDSAFADNGIYVSSRNENGKAFEALAIQSDHKILATGFVRDVVEPDVITRCVLMRFTPQGVPDSTFGSNGIVKTDFGEGNKVYLYPDGKITVVGMAIDPIDNSQKVFMARYLNDLGTAIRDKSITRPTLLEIYPNPGFGTLYLSWINGDRQDNISARIFNLQGDIVFSSILGPDNNELQLNLPPGAYVLQLAGKEETQSEIIIIQ